MRRKRLRRAANTAVVIALVATAAVVLGGGVGSTFAVFNAVTQNATTNFAAGWVGAPTGPSGVASGFDNDLAWTAGTAGPVTGQTLLGIDNGTNSNCTGAAYAALTTSPALTASTASYTDVNRGTSAANGDWYCYELESTSSTAWTAMTALPALQLGLAATGVATTNGGTAGRLDAGDTITLTFNQEIPSTVSDPTVLSAALSTSTAITSIPVVSLTGAIASGNAITLTSGTNTQTFTASSSAAIGATSIKVNSLKPTFAFPTTTFIADTTAGTVPNTSAALVCVYSSGTVVLGDTTGTCTAATDASSLGTLTISGGTISANEHFPVSTVAVASSSPWTVTITLGTISGGPATISSGSTWTYAPPTANSTTLTTALTSGTNATALAVSALPAPVANGDPILVTSGTHSETFAASVAAAAAATSITVTSKSANFSYPTSSTVIDLNDAIQNRVTTLSSALSTSGAITSIPVNALTGAIPSGDTVVLASGTNSQIFTTSSAVAIGATSIPVTSQTPNFAYPSGTSVIDTTDRATVCSAARSTCQPTTTTSF